MISVDMQPWHLMSVALRLRHEDLTQLRAMCSGGDRDPQLWACRTALRPGVAYSILTDDGMPIACLGATCEDGETGHLWFVATREFTRSVRAQILACKTVKAIMSRGGYASVQARCLSSNPYASRTLNALGLERCGEWRGLGRDGSDAFFYSKESEKCIRSVRSMLL